VIPLAEAKEVYDAARWPKRLIVVPEASHGLLNIDGPSYLGGLIQFLVNLE
jgi:fermentation-respiration switch protein FrsA (DUF1100 family)